MGGPMRYCRMVGRNRLFGPGYQTKWSTKDGEETSAEQMVQNARELIKGDMRRMEKDQRDEHHLQMYADHAGITVEQAKKVLDLFFKQDYSGREHPYDEDPDNVKP